MHRLGRSSRAIPEVRPLPDDVALQLWAEVLRREAGGRDFVDSSAAEGNAILVDEKLVAKSFPRGMAERDGLNPSGWKILKTQGFFACFMGLLYHRV